MPLPQRNRVETLANDTVTAATLAELNGTSACARPRLLNFTLRVLTDKGAWYMPESRPMMDLGKRKEQVTGELPSGVWAADGYPLIAPRADGLAAWAYRGQQGESFHCAGRVSEAGRFHVVLRGRVALGDAELPRNSCVFWSPPDTTPDFRALEDGSELVVVQFPETALHNVVAAELRAAAAAQLSYTTPESKLI